MKGAPAERPGRARAAPPIIVFKLKQPDHTTYTITFHFLLKRHSQQI